jgi:hypothetical protein
LRASRSGLDSISRYTRLFSASFDGGIPSSKAPRAFATAKDLAKPRVPPTLS